MNFTKLLTAQKVQASILFQTTVFLNVPFLKWYTLKHDVFFYGVASEGESKWTVINKVFVKGLLKVPRLELLSF